MIIVENGKINDNQYENLSETGETKNRYKLCSLTALSMLNDHFSQTCVLLLFRFVNFNDNNNIKRHCSFCICFVLMPYPCRKSSNRIKIEIG